MDPIGTNGALVGAAVIAVSHDAKEVIIVPGGDVMIIDSDPDTVLVGVKVVKAEELATVLDA